MNLISAIVHVHYGDCYHNKSEKVLVQGTTVVAGAAKNEYTGERAPCTFFLESTVRGYHIYKRIWTTLYEEILHTIAENNEVL